MKHFTSFLAFLSLFQTAFAQGISLDTDFGQNGIVITPVYSNSNNYTSHWDLSSDGEIVVFPEGTGAGYLFYTRYSINGDSLGTVMYPYPETWGPRILTVLAQEGGRFLVASSGDTLGLSMYQADGTLDPGFGKNGKAPTFYNLNSEIYIGHDKRIFTVGENHGYHKIPKGGVVTAYLPDGQVDSTFGNNGTYVYHWNQYLFFNRIRQHSDGKLVVAGCVIDDSVGIYNAVFQILPNGQPDPNFGTNGAVLDRYNTGGENYGLTLQDDGKILVSGNDYTQDAAIVIRYLPDGTRDPSFGDNGYVVLPMILESTDIMLLPNGKILLYGIGFNTELYSALIQLLPNGTLDPFFGQGGTYFGPSNNIRPPMRMQLVGGNKLIATGSYEIDLPNGNAEYLQIQAFTLDLNVGAISPDEKPSVWIYPNPVSDAVEVKFSLEQPAELQFELYDLQGKRVHTLLNDTSFESGEHRQSLQLPAIPDGNYFLQLMSAGKLLTTMRITKI